jgi:hypothetical protein
MKRFVLVILFILILTSGTGAQSDCVPVYGDINGDGVVNVSDLILLANQLAGNTHLSTPQKAAANVFYDGQVDVLDLFAMANFLAGNIKTLPVIPNR